MRPPRLLGINCVIEGAPPTPGEATCPISPTVFFEDGRCFRVVPPDASGQCPAGTTPAAGGGLCEEPVALVPGPSSCEPGFGNTGGRCLRFEPAVPGQAPCPPGSFEDADGLCRHPVANSAGAYFCADPAAALNGTSCVFTAAPVFGECAVGFELIDGSCLRFEDPSPVLACPVGTVDDSVGQCRLSVADVEGEPYCADPGATLVDQTCVQRENSVCPAGELIGETCLESTRVARTRPWHRGRSRHARAMSFRG